MVSVSDSGLPGKSSPVFSVQPQCVPPAFAHPGKYTHLHIYQGNFQQPILTYFEPAIHFWSHAEQGFDLPSSGKSKKITWEEYNPVIRQSLARCKTLPPGIELALVQVFDEH